MELSNQVTWKIFHSLVKHYVYAEGRFHCRKFINDCAEEKNVSVCPLCPVGSMILHICK